MSVAAKEARETNYWLRLALDGNVLPAAELQALLGNIAELRKVVTSIVKSASD